MKPDLDDYEPVFVQEAAKKKKKFESLFTLVAWRSNFFLESDFTIQLKFYNQTWSRSTNIKATHGQLFLLCIKTLKMQTSPTA